LGSERFSEEKENFSFHPHDSFLPSNILNFSMNKNFGTCFSEIFLVQIQKKFGKNVPKFLFKAKKIRKTHSEVFLQGQKKDCG
jgi:hypothetical protein